MVILKASNPAAGWKGPARRLLTHPLPFKYESTDPRPSWPMKWAMKLEGYQVSYLRNQDKKAAHLGLVKVVSVGEREGDFDTPIIPHRLGKGDHLSSASLDPYGETTHSHPIRVGRAILKDDPLPIRSNGRSTFSPDGHSLKLLLDPILQGLNTVFTNHNQLHPLGAVFLLPP